MHNDARPWTFYAFAAFFTLFVLFLYGPMFVIYILSFQGPNGGMTFPLNGMSLHWFTALVSQTRVGDIAGSFVRSIGLAAIVAVVTVVLAVLLGLPTEWYTTGLGAQLTWTLPFGLLIMFAVLGRFDRSYEEAAIDLGATNWQKVREVTLPILLPGIIGVALFGFTLSYDEIARTALAAGSKNTLPLEIWAMTTNVTSPTLYAVGAVTTIVSFVVIILALGSIAIVQRRRAAAGMRTE